MEAICSSETSVDICRTPRRYNSFGLQRQGQFSSTEGLRHVMFAMKPNWKIIRKIKASLETLALSFYYFEFVNINFWWSLISRQGTSTISSIITGTCAVSVCGSTAYRISSWIHILAAGYENTFPATDHSRNKFLQVLVLKLVSPQNSLG